MRINQICIYLFIFCTFNLSGCSKENNADLHKFVGNLKKQTTQATTDLMKEVHLRQEISYNASQAKNPFPLSSTASNATLANKPPLERYTLDALRLVGTIQEANAKFAVLLAPDGKVYQVGLNAPLGSRDGKITSITEQSIVVTEPSSAGLPGRNVVLRL